MPIQEVVTAISTVGFPIAACCGLFYMYDKTIKDLTIILNKIDSTNQMILEMIKERNDDDNTK